MVVETPKYTSDSPQILGLTRTAQKLPVLPPISACCSLANFSSNHDRSSPCNQCASFGLSDSTKNTAAPNRMAGTPSIRNIHCHPESPLPLSPSSAPEMGLPLLLV